MRPEEGPTFVGGGGVLPGDARKATDGNQLTGQKKRSVSLSIDFERRCSAKLTACPSCWALGWSCGQRHWIRWYNSLPCLRIPGFEWGWVPRFEPMVPNFISMLIRTIALLLSLMPKLYKISLYSCRSFLWIPLLFVLFYLKKTKKNTFKVFFKSTLGGGYCIVLQTNKKYKSLCSQFLSL